MDREVFLWLCRSVVSDGGLVVNLGSIGVREYEQRNSG